MNQKSKKGDYSTYAKSIDIIAIRDIKSNKEQYYIRHNSVANQRYDMLKQAVTAIDVLIR